MLGAKFISSCSFVDPTKTSSRFYIILVDDINDVYTIAEIGEKLNGNMDEMSMFSQPFSGIVYATVSHFDLDKESRNYVTIRWFVHF